MYRFPKDLFTDVRIESQNTVQYYIRNGEVEGDSNVSVSGAMVRVYDGEMWYTSFTNNLDKIQEEIDNLATIASPNEKIYDDPVIQNFGACQDDVTKYSGENNVKNISRSTYVKLVNDYIDQCVDSSIEEIKSYSFGFGSSYIQKEY